MVGTAVGDGKGAEEGCVVAVGIMLLDGAVDGRFEIEGGADIVTVEKSVGEGDMVGLGTTNGRNVGVSIMSSVNSFVNDSKVVWAIERWQKKVKQAVSFILSWDEELSDYVSRAPGSEARAINRLGLVEFCGQGFGQRGAGSCDVGILVQ